MISYGPVLEICNISKSFRSVPVLKNVSFNLHPGEVCGFLGENGAGKSVLMKILIGMLPMDSGVIKINGEQVDVMHSRPQTLGIHATLQGENLIESLSVGANIFLHREIMYENSPVINRQEIEVQSDSILQFMSSDISSVSIVGNLSLAQSKIVEICKAFAFNPKVVILDEPSAPLDHPDTVKMFECIRLAKEKGIAIIYISHDIDEVMAIADRVIVINHGEVVENELVSDIISPVHILESMAGRDLRNRYPKINVTKGNVLFEAQGLTNAAQTIRDISFQIKSGEIVGIAGLRGAGKSSVAKAIFGLEPLTEGQLYLDGSKLQINSPHQALSHGIAYLSDNVEKNIFLNLSAFENINFLSYQDSMVGPFINFKKLTYIARKELLKFHIRLHRDCRNLNGLSMGTLQKLAISRLGLIDNKVFVMDDASQQLDVPSKVELYNIMNKIALSKKALLFISSDIDELIGMCDRILIMRGGEIVQEMNTKLVSSKSVLQCFYGK